MQLFKFSRKYALENIFVFFCIFPYIQIIPLNTDSQPYAFLLGCLYLAIHPWRKIYDSFFKLLLCVFAACAFAILSSIDFNALRSIIGYFSLFVISLTTYRILKSKYVLSFNVLKKYSYIWFVFGIIQLFISPSFGTFLIPRGGFSSENYGRGATSLAPEPTYYAIICAFFMIVAYLNFKSNKDYKKFQIIQLIQIFILSRSSTIILLLTISYIANYIILLSKRNIKKTIIAAWGIIMVLLFIPILLPYISQYRIGSILSIAIKNPNLLLTKDESVNERFCHLYFPIYAFINDYGIPHFFNTFADYVTELYKSNKFNDILCFFKPEHYNRIMSGFGSAIFELGLIGLLIPYVVVKESIRVAKNRVDSIFFCLLFIFIMFNAMPLSNAFVGLLVGNIIYHAEKFQYDNNFIERK